MVCFVYPALRFVVLLSVATCSAGLRFHTNGTTKDSLLWSGDAALEFGYALRLMGGRNTSSLRKEAVVTHACSDSWMPGVLALSASLRAVNTNADIVVMISKNVGLRFQQLAQLNFDKVFVEEPITPHPSITRKAADCVTLKFHIWHLPYSKVLYMDGDTLAVGPVPVHDMLAHTKTIRANIDPGLEDQFNAGMIALAPSDKTFSRLVSFMKHQPAPSGFAPKPSGDQAFLNRAFPNCRVHEAQVGCWEGNLGNNENKFTRDLTEPEVEDLLQYTLSDNKSAIKPKYNTIHFSGDWGYSAKPWMKDCLQRSDSLGSQSRLRKPLVELWRYAFSFIVHTNMSMLDDPCPA